MKIWMLSVLVAQNHARANPIDSLHRHLDNMMSDLDAYAESHMHPRAASELNKIQHFVKKAFGSPSKSSSKSNSQPTGVCCCKLFLVFSGEVNNGAGRGTLRPLQGCSFSNPKKYMGFTRCI